MPSNSALRAAVKRALGPLLPEALYRQIQAASMARDIRSGALTEPEVDLVALAVRPGEVALDLGANYGMYAPALDRAVGSTGGVYAFEPIPFTAATLRRVLRLLRVQNIEVREQAVGAENTRTSFAVPLQTAGVPSAGQAHASARDDSRSGREQHVRWDDTTIVECEVVRLDDAIADPRAISLVKADIEGAELFAFRGATGLIDRWHPTVICEINPWFLEGFGLSVAELAAFFSDRGYRLYRYREADRRLAEVTDLAEVDEDNYVFAHPDRIDRLAPVMVDGTLASARDQPSGAG